MRGYFCNIVIFSIGLVNNSWALPWFQHPNEGENSPQSQSSRHNKTQENPINFSGVWEGQCDHNPAIALTIKHNQNQLTISYGFMEEKYVLGEIKSIASSRAEASENSNNTVRWSTDHTALIFTNYYLFTHGTSKSKAIPRMISHKKQSPVLIIANKYLTPKKCQVLKNNTPIYRLGADLLQFVIPVRPR